MKKFDENRFDDLIREKFRDFSENPPDIVFDRLTKSYSEISRNKPFWKNGGFITSAVLVFVTASVILLINSFGLKNNDYSQPLNPTENQIVQNAGIVYANVPDEVKISEAVSPKENHNFSKTNNTEEKSSILVNEAPVSENIPDENIPLQHEDKQSVKEIIPAQDNDIDINVSVVAAVCGKPAGIVFLSSSQDVKFYWPDLSETKPVDVMKNLKPGVYKVVSVTAAGSKKTFSVTVPDSGKVIAAFTHYELSLAPDVPVYFANNTSVVDLPAGEVSYKWDFGDGKASDEANPEHIYTKPGSFKISLFACTKQGCKDSSIAVVVINGSIIEPPNIFTPNGDGINDIFRPATQALRSFHCTVYNRAGEKIYEWTDPTQGWDGKINKGLDLADPGTYYYVMKGVGTDGKIICHKGSFLLSLEGN